MSGPLQGIKVVELTAIGPVPHAAMILADLGADVVRIERPDTDMSALANDYILRGRRTVGVNLKNTEDRERLLSLVSQADVLVEGYRPGVAERLGVGPDDCLKLNPRLVYARMTGWGQTGPLALSAGHDINYLALTGALHAMGDADRPPVPPLNLVGDYGGGSMLLLVGVLAALVSRDRTGHGQVLDVAMVDGVTLLMQAMWSMRANGTWFDERSANLADGGAPFYRSYRCSDDRFIAVGPAEPQFYTQFLAGLGLDEQEVPDRTDPENWARLTDTFAAIIGSRTRDEWAEVFAGTDACVTPILTYPEALQNPHLQARHAHVTLNNVPQSAPAPRFSATPSAAPVPPSETLHALDGIVEQWASR